MIACKDAKTCQKYWYSNAAFKQLQMRRRLRPLKSGMSALKYVDATILENYRVPHSAYEVMFCRSPNAPPDCSLGRGFHVDKPHFSMEDVEVRDDGRVFTKKDMSMGSYIIEAGITMQFERSTLEVLRDSKYSPASALFSHFANDTGNYSKYAGYVSTGLPVLLSSVGADPNVGSLTAYLAQEGLCYEHATPGHCHRAHNIVVDRHLSSYGAGVLLALRDIKAGEELILE